MNIPFFLLSFIYIYIHIRFTTLSRNFYSFLAVSATNIVSYVPDINNRLNSFIENMRNLQELIYCEQLPVVFKYLCAFRFILPFMFCKEITFSIMQLSLLTILIATFPPLTHQTLIKRIIQNLTYVGILVGYQSSHLCLYKIFHYCLQG